MSSGAEAAAVVNNFFDAMAARDSSRIGELVAADVSWTFPGDLPFSGKHVGKDAVLSDLLAASAPYFEPGHLRIEMHNLICEGGLVVADYTGHNLTTTGRRYENRYVFFFAVNNGLICSIRSYFDTAHMKALVFR